MNDLLKTEWLADGAQTIFLLRHGVVQRANDNKHFIGQTDLPLNEVGLQQAHHWRQWLSDVPLARIITSDLQRCTTTAEIIATEHSADILQLSELREIDLGTWDGMSFQQIKQRWPDSFRERGLAIDRFRPPAGESFFDLRQRVVPVFENALDSSIGNTLIVAHAGVNRIILCHILGMPVENLLRIAQGLGAMNLIRHQAASYRIQAINLLPGQPDCDAAAW